MTSRHDWFADWIESQVLATVVAAKGPDAARMLAAFGPTRFDQGERTLDEVIRMEVSTVRIGTTPEGWVYSVETRTVAGGDPAFLQRLTADGGSAVSLCFTGTVSGFSYAEDGEHINGFDIVLPAFRFGRDPQAFDSQMGEAGLLAEDRPRPTAAAADFVERAFGLTITRAMLEDRLPCATIPALPRTPLMVSDDVIRQKQARGWGAAEVDAVAALARGALEHQTALAHWAVQNEATYTPGCVGAEPFHTLARLRDATVGPFGSQRGNIPTGQVLPWLALIAAAPTEEAFETVVWLLSNTAPFMAWQALGPIAPLAFAAGLTVEDAEAQQAMGALDPEALRALAVQRGYRLPRGQL